MAHGVQFFANHDDTALLAEIYVHPGSGVRDCEVVASKLQTLVPAIRGVLVFANSPGADDARQRDPASGERAEAYNEFGSMRE